MKDKERKREMLNKKEKRIAEEKKEGTTKVEKESRSRED
jgi:hypothetical protein